MILGMVSVSFAETYESDGETTIVHEDAESANVEYIISSESEEIHQFIDSIPDLEKRSLILDFYLTPAYGEMSDTKEINIYTSKSALNQIKDLAKLPVTELKVS